MKKLFLILLIVSISSAQYGKDLVTNGSMEADANWVNYSTPDANERSSVQKHGGTYSRRIVGNDNEGTQQLNFNTLTVTTYTLHYWMYPAKGASYLTRTTNGIGPTVVINEIYSPTLAQWNEYTFDHVEPDGGVGSDIQFRFNAGLETDSAYFDDVSFRKKLTTLYITKAGNDANEGESGTPILTLEQAQTRGFYSGGAFDIAAGTYDETFTVNNDVTITGNSCTVTEIACGANVVTLEGLDFVITTLTGSAYVDNRTWTPTATEDEEPGFNHYPGWKGFNK